MNKKYLIGNSILWATAIIASAIVHAPACLTLCLLPALAVGSGIIGTSRPGRRGCLPD